MAILLGFFHPLDWTGLGNGPQWVALGCTVLCPQPSRPNQHLKQNAGIVFVPVFFAAARLSSFIQQEQQGQVTHDSAQVGQVFIRFYRVGWLDFY